jgi:DNA-directed RNA polymerase alpha subunit
MKYLEELKPGDAFFYRENIFVLTIDFKFKDKNKYSYAININSGAGVWLPENTTVESIQIYYIDKDKNIVPVKHHSNDDTKN